MTETDDHPYTREQLIAIRNALDTYVELRAPSPKPDWVGRTVSLLRLIDALLTPTVLAGIDQGLAELIAKQGEPT